MPGDCPRTLGFWFLFPQKRSPPWIFLSDVVPDTLLSRRLSPSLSLRHQGLHCSSHPPLGLSVHGTFRLRPGTDMPFGCSLKALSHVKATLVFLSYCLSQAKLLLRNFFSLQGTVSLHPVSDDKDMELNKHLIP